MGDSSLEHLNEQDLWLRFQNGDGKAFAEIYERYVGVLYNYGYNLAPDGALVEDAIQELFTYLWQTRKNLSPTTSIKYYLFRSLRRQIHRQRKFDQRFERISEMDESLPLPEVPSAESLQVEAEIAKRQIRELQKALSQLPSRQIEAIRLLFFEGFPLSEVANLMGINEQSVRNLVRRSIHKLKRVFEFLPFLLLVFQDFF